MTCPRAPAARGFQVHFSVKGQDERNPEPREEADHWPLMKPDSANGSERREFRNLGEVGLRDEFGPAGVEGFLCIDCVVSQHQHLCLEADAGRFGSRGK